MTARTAFELWKSDGTAAGTVMVKDINPGSGNSAPLSLTNVNGKLYFAANDGADGDELWKSDGTAAGTLMVKDIIFGVWRFVRRSDLAGGQRGGGILRLRRGGHRSLPVGRDRRRHDRARHQRPDARQISA